MAGRYGPAGGNRRGRIITGGIEGGLGGFSCLSELLREAVEHVFLGGAGTDASRRKAAKLGVDAGARGARGEGPGQDGPRLGRGQPRLKTRP